MKSYREFLLTKEEAPTNNAGTGQIDGIGVGPKGEPGGKPPSKILSRLVKRKGKLK